MSKLIWIDTTSGTWGRVQDSNGSLVLIDLEDEAQIDTDAGESQDVDGLLAFLEGASDGEIAQYGLEHGVRPVPVPSQEQFNSAVEVMREAMELARTGLDGAHSGSGLMLKIMGRLGLIELPPGLR